MSRDKIDAIIQKLSGRQMALSNEIMSSVRHEDLEKSTDDGFTVNDTLQMWAHELRSHHRDLVLARGRLANDNPHHHVPHYVRQANEEFGRFIGELAALSDEGLDRRIEPDGRTVREIAEHVLGTLEGYFAQQLQTAIDREDKPGETSCRDD